MIQKRANILDQREGSRLEGRRRVLVKLRREAGSEDAATRRHGDAETEDAETQRRGDEFVSVSPSPRVSASSVALLLVSWLPAYTIWLKPSAALLIARAVCARRLGHEATEFLRE